MEYSIKVEKVSKKRMVDVSVKLSGENDNAVIKKVLSLYCKRKNIESIKIQTQWINTSKVSKLLKKEPSFVVFIKLEKYLDQFSLLNELLMGCLYKFESEKEVEEFINQCKFVIKEFLDERLKIMMDELKYFLAYDTDDSSLILI